MQTLLYSGMARSEPSVYDNIILLTYLGGKYKECAVTECSHQLASHQRAEKS